MHARYFRGLLFPMLFTALSGASHAAPSTGIRSQGKLITNRDGSLPQRAKFSNPAAAREARELLQALREGSARSFRPLVEGQSLIPLETLVELGRSRYAPPSGGRSQLRQVNEIRVEWNEAGTPFLVVRYARIGKDRSEDFEIDAENLTRWRRYLAKVAGGRPAWLLDLTNPPEGRIDPFESVRTGDFKQLRTSGDYNSGFQGRLESRKNLLRGSDQVWIDMGAGYANTLLNFLTRRILRHARTALPMLWAIGFKYPGGSVKDLEASLPKEAAGRFQYVEGRQSPASLKRLPQADLITDIMGIYTYAENPHGVFRAYLSRLKENGELFLYSYSLDPQSIAYLARNQDSFSIIQRSDAHWVVKRVAPPRTRP